MARPTEINRTPMAETVRKLRLSMNETQEAFARRIGVSAVTIARYETNAYPKKVFAKRLAALARERHLEDYARFFEGDQSVVVLFQEEEFIAAMELMQATVKEVSMESFRALRCAITLLHKSQAANLDLDQIEKAIGPPLWVVDQLINVKTGLNAMQQGMLFDEQRSKNKNRKEPR
jgi:transcriptional regulator with XRE-family HTH domain